jgi:23S rRNA pseudouridine955/2504/2580 synthase
MREFIIAKNDAGQRLDRWLSKNFPLLPPPLAQKYIRLKRVKVNGKGAKRDTRLLVGDLLALYINDEFFDRPTPENAFLSVLKPQLDILYEDENLLLINKRPGIVVHADETERVNTLITHIQAYLYLKREWTPYTERSFTPALCNRIDRNTGGIVIAAKNAETLRIINQKIRDREIEKYYLCIIHGRITPSSGRLQGFLLKDEAKKQVSIHTRPIPGGKTAMTDYRTLDATADLSLMECHLLTGRTHQIRAQFAAAGHPLLGDGKYGREKDNKRYHRSFQALYSYKLTFSFQTESGILAYLNGKTWSVSDVDFVPQYFPNYIIK